MISRDRVKVVIGLLATQCLLSCAWNRAFLEPARIPPGDRMGTSVDPATGDTSFLSITGSNSQPAFLDSERKALALPYSIKSYVLGQPGEQVNCWHVCHADRAAEFTIIFLHGNGGSIYTEYPVMLPLVERGAAVYMVDYRGYGRSEGRASRKNVIEDAKAFVKDALVRNQGSGLPVVLYGQSLGGHTAAIVSGSSWAGIDGVVIESGFLSFKEMARRSGGMGFVRGWLTKEGPQAGKALAQYGGPLLVIHSPEDEVVPLSQAEELFAVHQGQKRIVKLSGAHASAPVIHPDTVVSEIRKLLLR